MSGNHASLQKRLKLAVELEDYALAQQIQEELERQKSCDGALDEDVRSRRLAELQDRKKDAVLRMDFVEAGRIQEEIKSLTFEAPHAGSELQEVPAPGSVVTISQLDCDHATYAQNVNINYVRIVALGKKHDMSSKGPAKGKGKGKKDVGKHSHAEQCQAMYVATEAKQVLCVMAPRRVLCQKMPSESRLHSYINISGLYGRPNKRLVMELGDNSIIAYTLTKEIKIKYPGTLDEIMTCEKLQDVDLQSFIDFPMKILSIVKKTAWNGNSYCELHGQDANRKSMPVLRLWQMEVADVGKMNDLVMLRGVKVVEETRWNNETGAYVVVSGSQKILDWSSVTSAVEKGPISQALQVHFH